MTDNKTSAIEKKARELDELFRNHAQTSQIQKFFNRNRQNLIPIFLELIFPEALFDPDLIAKLEFHIVQAICNFLRQDTGIHASREMHYSSLILASDRIAPEKKALFWHILSDACPVGIGVLGNYYAKDVFMDNIQARYCSLFHRKTGKKRDFIKHTLSGRKGEKYGFFGGRSDEMISYKPSDWIQVSVENDQVSVFEIERQIHGQNITVSMLLYLLNRHAVNCFLYLLKNYPKKSTNAAPRRNGFSPSAAMPGKIPPYRSSGKLSLRFPASLPTPATLGETLCCGIR